MRHRVTPPTSILIALGSALLLALLALVALGPALGAASEPTPLLPDLVADPPDAIGLATDTSTGTPHLLLRFNGYIHNKGPGAIDIRGSRTAPTLSPAVEKQVKEAESKQEGLPESIEQELAASPMHVSQRLFKTNVGEEETNIERAHVDEPSGAEVIFSSADGHHHWHLQHAAKYSLWNAAKSAEVAPAQKVGFCLDDSQHVETNIGPSKPVYADSVPPFRDFCQQYRPNATSLFEGISPGWRDLYGRELAFQWVDASSVLPGEYWLREEVNPLGAIKETGGANVPVYAASPTIIPGFDALAQLVSTNTGEATTVTLSAKAWSDSNTPSFTLVSGPQHGTLKAGAKGNQAIYTPQAGFTGHDSFTFSAADPNSPFPASPAVATVSIEVGEPEGEPSVSIQAPGSMKAGESTQLTAQVLGDSPNVTWTASEGAITPSGLYTAPVKPPPGGVVTITATTAKGASDKATILILAVQLPDVTIENAPATIAPGVGAQLAALVQPEGESVSWEASGGTITPDGFFTAPAAVPAGGVVTVTAKTATAQATVTIHVAALAEAALAIEGAPASMIAGTSVQLNARGANSGEALSWSASAGSITSSGLYTAPGSPPSGGVVSIRVTGADGASDSRTITITAVPVAQPAPEASLAGVLGQKRATLAAVSRPRVALIGRTLTMTTLPTVAGRVRLSAYLGHRRLGTCVTQTPADRSFTCRLKLARSIPARARIGVLASLRIGRKVLRSWRAPAPIVEMRMTALGGVHSALAAAAFWCTPSLANPAAGS